MMQEKNKILADVQKSYDERVDHEMVVANYQHQLDLALRDITLLKIEREKLIAFLPAEQQKVKLPNKKKTKFSAP